MSSSEIKKIAPAQQMVLSILCAHLKRNNSQVTNADIEIWKAALDISRKQRVLLLIYDYLKNNDSNVPKEVITELKRFYRVNAIRNLNYERELVVISRLFRQTNIPFILLKGIGLSKFLYGDPALRPCVDIDILVRPEHDLKARKLLETVGYSSKNKLHQIQERFYRVISNECTLYHSEHHIMLELHNKYLPKSRSSYLDIHGIWERTHTINFGDTIIHVLSPEDLLIYLSVHSSKEFWGSLLHLYDMAALIVNHSDLNWEIVFKRAGAFHCRRRLLFSLILIKKVFGIPPHVVDEDTLTELYAQEPIIGIALKKLLISSYEPPKIWSTRLWLDLNLADRWFDRFLIIFYKGCNMLAKVMPTRSADS